MWIYDAQIPSASDRTTGSVWKLQFDSVTPVQNLEREPHGELGSRLTVLVAARY